jgi:hypothetical protein
MCAQKTTEVQADPVADKIDEIADIGEMWKRNRDKGRNPKAIRTAMIIAIDELVDIISANLPQDPSLLQNPSEF